MTTISSPSLSAGHQKPLRTRGRPCDAAPSAGPAAGPCRGWSGWAEASSLSCVSGWGETEAGTGPSQLYVVFKQRQR